MPRPRNASYKSHKLIHNALINGPKYFEELKRIAQLHRNTLATRLKFLISEGLIEKTREGCRIYYRDAQPLRDEHGIFRTDGLKWFNYIAKPEEKRRLKRQLRAMIREQIENRKILNRFYELLANFDEELDRLLDITESEEILNLIDDWQNIPMPKIWSILALNKTLVNLNSEKRICPECHHYGTIEDNERNEIVCESCGCVVGDEIIQPRERLEMILAFLENTQID
jgi:DNA-binding transcriptional ArsR family regulator